MPKKEDEILMNVKNLKKTFHIKSNNGHKCNLQAVAGVSFHIYKGETLGLVGESGCGKSTLGRTLLGLYEPDENSEIIFSGNSVINLNSKQRKKFALETGLIFQDPSACLNPRRTVKQILAEPLIIHKLLEKKQMEERILELMEMVGMASYHLNKFPHEMSGGQKQRVGIARALALNPKLIICDEPVSALDVSVQAQIINLLEDLQKELNLTYLFISHNLNIVYHTSARVGVMYLGKIVELADRDSIYSETLHPYTEALVSSIPSTTEETSRNRIVLKGDVPSPSNPPKGCRFHTRCPKFFEKCSIEEPELRECKPGHYVACHLHNAMNYPAEDQRVIG